MSESEAKNERNEANQWVSVREAAERLGIGERAVQLRAKNGLIESRREGRQWFVRLPADAPTSISLPDSIETDESSETKRSERNRTSRTEANPALVEELKSEVAFLRALVETHTEETARRDVAEAELRRLLLADRNELAQLRQRLALAAQEDTEGGETKDGKSATPEASAGRRWWQVWKR